MIWAVGVTLGLSIALTVALWLSEPAPIDPLYAAMWFICGGLWVVTILLGVVLWAG